MIERKMRQLKCNDCGFEWLKLKGIGWSVIKDDKALEIRLGLECPKCLKSIFLVLKDNISGEGKTKIDYIG